MFDIKQSGISCGVKIFQNVPNLEQGRNRRKFVHDLLTQAANRRFNGHFVSVGAFYIYAGIAGNSNEQDLTDFIVNRDLGTVFETDPVGNQDVVVWTFLPDWQALTRYNNRFPADNCLPVNFEY